MTKSNTSAVVNQLRSAGILKVSEEAETMVSKLMADNAPKATTRKLLKPPCADKESRREMIDDDDLEYLCPDRRAGGQHVGVSTTLLVIHKPTGIAVCESGERSQHKNKVRALERLYRLLELSGYYGNDE